jgi:hypothetical protein
MALELGNSSDLSVCLIHKLLLLYRPPSLVKLFSNQLISLHIPGTDYVEICLQQEYNITHVLYAVRKFILLH